MRAVVTTVAPFGAIAGGCLTTTGDLTMPHWRALLFQLNTNNISWIDRIGDSR